MLTTTKRPPSDNIAIMQYPSSAERGLLGRLLAKLHSRVRAKSRLLVIEKITLSPRQCLALVEADGQRLLIATSGDGTPAFYPLAARGRTRSSGRSPKTNAMESAK